ncbi:MAG: gamma-glutamyl-gamma-aminobutyrate hydrolase family protein [Candidatus Hodarchaeota archaeon]
MANHTGFISGNVRPVGEPAIIIREGANGNWKMKKRIHVISNYKHFLSTRKLLLSPNRELGLIRMLDRVEAVFPRKLIFHRHSFIDLKEEDTFRAILNSDGVILSGSSLNLSSPKDRDKMNNEIQLVRELEVKNVPTLGICFGHQLIALAFGARIAQMTGKRYNIEKEKEFSITFDEPFPLYKPSSPGNELSMWVDSNHNDEVIPTDEFNTKFNVYSRSGNPANVIQAIKHRSADMFGVQFHPESFTGNLRIHDDGFEIFHQFIQLILSR